MCGTNPNWINTIRACPIRAIYVAADGPNGWALGALGELFYYISDQNEWFEACFSSFYLFLLFLLCSNSNFCLGIVLFNTHYRCYFLWT